MVKKHSNLIGQTVVDEQDVSDVETDPRFWHDVMDLYFIRGKESRGRQDDDLVFFVRKVVQFCYCLTWLQYLYLIRLGWYQSSNSLSDLWFERNLKGMAMMMIMEAPRHILFAGGHLRYITSIPGSDNLCTKWFYLAMPILSRFQVVIDVRAPLSGKYCICGIICTN